MKSINTSDYYDETNPESIEKYSQKLIEKSFRNVLEDYFEDDLETLEEKIKYFNNPRGKGSLGNLIEEFFFFFEPNSSPEADFEKAGVELKVTPIKELKSGKYSAAERLVLSMIPNDRALESEVEKSELFSKITLMLLVIYLRETGKPRIENIIKFCKLFNLKSETCEEDLEIIKQDYRKISYKINNGLAHTISEGDTLYLGACTKGATASRSLQPQYNSDIPAKRRAFSLKSSYMTYILRNYILKDKDTYAERIVKNTEELKTSDFENIITDRIGKYIGRSENQLLKEFKVDYLRSKDKHSLLAFRMLGVGSNSAEEFTKANIVVKTIRIMKNNKIKESMSFPTFKIKEFVKEEWEESSIYNFFSETKLLFMVFKENSQGEYIFKGSQFWNMPIEELEGLGQKEWKSIQNVFKEGVKLIPTQQKNRVIVKNNIPASSETEIFHVRPHASKSVYNIGGKKYGSGNEKTDGDVLPNGDIMTKQCFWLNNKYVLKQLSEKFL